MTQFSEDAKRSIAAAKVLLDGRHPVKDRSEVLVNLDHFIALVLITCMDQDAKKALGMFHEGTVPMVEEWIMKYEDGCRS
jgi:hypothetical protein